MTRRVVRVEGIVPVARGYPAAVVANGLAFIGGVRGTRADRAPRFVDLPEQFRRNGFSGFPIADQAEGGFRRRWLGRARQSRSRHQGGRLGRDAGAAPAYLAARQAAVPGLRAHSHGVAGGAGAEQLPRRCRRGRTVRPLGRARGARRRSGRRTRCFPDAPRRVPSTTRTFRRPAFIRKRFAAARSCFWRGISRSRPASPGRP